MKKDDLQILTSENAEPYLPVKDMIGVLEYQALHRPDKVVYYFLEDGSTETARITYAEMSLRVKAVASKLQQYISKGDRVVLLFPPGIEFIVGLFGCFYAGAIGVPAYPPRKNRLFDRFSTIVRDCDPTVFLTNEKIGAEMQRSYDGLDFLKGKEIITYEDIHIELSGKWKRPDIELEDIALLQYTSGSTGIPDGVIVTHENILHNSETIRRAFGHTPDLRGVNWLPGFHDMGLIGALIQPVYVGGSNAIIPPNSFLLRPVSWLRAISVYRGTTVGGPNFSLDYLVERMNPDELHGIDLKSVNPFFCGAEPIRKETLERFAETMKPTRFSCKQFYPCYGLAEATLIVTGGDLDNEPVMACIDSKEIEKGKVRAVEPGHPNARFLVGCGFPWAGTAVAIVDPESHSVCKDGRIGEIWVSGRSVAKGYWNKPEKSKETFRAYTADGEGPFLRTGDLGFIQSGQLFITGRLKDLIIIRGANHYPQDIEQTMESSHEAIAPGTGAAFSIDERGEERLVVVQEIRRTHLRDLDAEAVFGAIRQAIAENHQLQVYAITLIRTGTIPKTSSGKIQRFACRQEFLDGGLNVVASWNLAPEAERPFIPEESDIHEWIKNWMARELKISADRIDVDEPITRYGLDSLKAVLLARDASEQFNTDIPLDIFLEETTITGIAGKAMQVMNSLES